MGYGLVTMSNNEMTSYFFQDPNNGLDLVLCSRGNKLSVVFGADDGDAEAEASRAGWEKLVRAFTTTDEVAEALSRYAPDILG